MHVRKVVAVCAGVLASMVAAASASAISFTRPVVLKGTDGTSSTGPFGGEPSIAVDPLGHV